MSLVTLFQCRPILGQEQQQNRLELFRFFFTDPTHDFDQLGFNLLINWFD